MRFFIARASATNRRLRRRGPPAPGAQPNPDTTDWYDAWTIDVDTIDDLTALARRLGCSILVDPDDSWGPHLRITIADDYLE